MEEIKSFLPAKSLLSKITLLQPSLVIHCAVKQQDCFDIGNLSEKFSGQVKGKPR